MSKLDKGTYMISLSLWILVLSLCSVSFALAAEPSIIEGAKKEAALVFYTTMDIQNSKPVSFFHEPTRT